MHTVIKNLAMSHELAGILYEVIGVSDGSADGRLSFRRAYRLLRTTEERSPHVQRVGPAIFRIIIVHLGHRY